MKTDYVSAQNPMFRSAFAEKIFTDRYLHEGAETWELLADLVVEDVCREWLDEDTKGELKQAIKEMKFIPGGRYLYYAGKPKKFFNNCFCLKSEEDTREDWARLSRHAELCLSTGGGIGNDYSIYRPSGSVLHGTGGVASGPIPKMEMVNGQGRGIVQGGSRRSALYASLAYNHGDIQEFLKVKNWYDQPVAGTDKSVGQLKEIDFNYIAPMDMTNLAVNYNTGWLTNYWETGDVGEIFTENVRQALSTGEPGFSFNFFAKEEETLRNACAEVTSSDDSDVCNLGAVNLGRVSSFSDFCAVLGLGTKFLICGSLVADLPYRKVKRVLRKNRRLGVGLMGIHEWLIKRGYKYEVVPELHRWLYAYKSITESTSRSLANTLSIARPVASRSIAPTGTIGILAGTTTGIEPLFAVAYKRRYLRDGKRWHYQYVIDSVAEGLIRAGGLAPEDIETSLSLASEYEKRIKFQADVQDYVDMGISSTINLSKWGTGENNEDGVDAFSKTLAHYAHRLRGFTCYPDGCRGGQPLVAVPYDDAITKLGEEYEEGIRAHDQCEITGKGGTCGV